MLKTFLQTAIALRGVPLATTRPSTFKHKQSLLCGFPCRPSGVRSQHRMAANPKLVVFDLDYTLWPFWVDTHVDPPFKMGSNGKVYDSRNQLVKYYPDVPEILSKLHSEGYTLGIASRTTATEDATDLICLFNWDSFFHYRQIYPGCKITHFKMLQSLSGIPYEDMLFFDDENRNIKDVSALGVSCMFVPDDGVTHNSLREGFELFQTNYSKRSSTS